jgi:hypothetical protein
MYTDENARFADQLGVSTSVFSGPIVTLELPPKAAHHPEAGIAFMMAANLLCRIFTKLHLVAPDIQVGPNAWAIRTLSELVDPLSEISEGDVSWGPAASTEIAVAVGAASTIPPAHATFFSFSGWDAALELELVGSQPGPLAALFSACYGAAQAFIYAARIVGAQYRPIRPFRLSLLNYEEVSRPVEFPLEVNIPDTHLVGVGAVGSALVYSLAHLRSINGNLTAIDDDFVDFTNLGRYILMRKADAIPQQPNQTSGKAKVEVAVNALSRHGVRAEPCRMTFKEFRTGRKDPIELLLTPVDSEAGRCELAADLPRMVLNAATGHSTVTISRHHFDDGKACLRCLYLPRENALSTEMRLADALGMPVAEVKDHLANNCRVPADLARRIESHLRRPAGSLDSFVGQHLQSLYQRAICGHTAIDTSVGTVVSPLSFISAAAGVMLAVELVKVSVPELLLFALDNYFRIDTMANPNPDFKEAKMQEPTRRCICWDPVYQAVYRQRFRQ